MDALQFINEWDLLDIANKRLQALRTIGLLKEARPSQVEEIQSILEEVRQRFLIAAQSSVTVAAE